MEQLVIDIENNRVALLLGAGADIAMSNALRWDQLVQQLFPSTYPPDSWLLSSWVIEMAAVARQLLGDQEYCQKVQNGTGSVRAPSPLWSALENMSKRIPLIVTTNYSRWLFSALSSGVSPVVIDRTTLRSARLPEPGVQVSRPTLVHLHGRGNELVLDRFGYDHAEHQDLLYKDFLVQLFERWTVLSIGFSFSDPPVRFAASLARTRRPELRKSHYWIDKGSPDRRYLWHSRAAFLAYSVRRIECGSHADVATMANALSTEKSTNISLVEGQIRRKDYKSLANALDLAGDYESSYQRAVFREHGFTLGLCKKLQSERVDGILLARLERHMRHHLQLIQPRSRAAELRSMLWRRVAACVESNALVLRAVVADPQLHFDFLVGALEVGERAAFHRLTGMLGNPTSSILAERFARAQEIWPLKANSNPLMLNELRQWAAGVGWESIESKVALDQARALAAKTARNWTKRRASRDSDAVLATTSMSLRTAQYAGTLRRAVGSLILQSLWLPYDTDAKAVLRSAVVLAQEGAGLEPTLTQAVAWAWQRVFSNRKEAFEEVAWQSPPSSGSLREQEKYWASLAAPLRS